MRRQTWVLFVLILAAGSAHAAAPNPATRKGVPAGPKRPLITITAQDSQGSAAETRLSHFITALQLGNRQEAEKAFSQKVTPEERQSFLQGRWPARTVGNGHDMSVILFQPDLQIRTRNRYTDALRMDVTQRKRQVKPRKSAGLGLTYLPVKMRLESGDWKVDLHPYRADVPVRVSHPAHERREREKNARKASPKGAKPAPKGATPAR